ncbi:hypothetical protein DRO97_01950 [Archaeoglobales archaeon]|nr:MAG: hypothetical protein DRO97_01950 [Archaeoglobales archaeon]
MKRILFFSLFLLLLAGTASAEYVRTITVQNNANVDLTNYQVKVELDSLNFDFSKTDGSDIRFKLSDNTELSYWIEEWDSANEYAIVWVKIPSIPASSSIDIYMYYGDSQTQSESDGAATFEFFDDFENGRWGIRYENNPVVSPTEPGQAGTRYPSIIYDADDGKYKMWYDVLSTNGGDYNVTIWYAESTDGIHWTNHQKVFEGTGVDGDFDKVSVSVGTVIKDGSIYRMWYTGRPVTGCGSNSSYGIGYAESTDGIHWTRGSNNPLLLASDFGCTFISGSTVIQDTDGKWRMVVQTDRDGSLKLYRGESDYPDRGWTFSTTPIITNPTGSHEINEGKLMKIGNRYYVIHPYDNGGGCSFTATYSYSDDWVNWQSCVEDLLPFEGGCSGVKHFIGISVPGHHGGNYVFPDRQSVDLYLYWSHGESYGYSCSDDTDWRISLAYFDGFPSSTWNFGGTGSVDFIDGWAKMHGTNNIQTMTLKEPVSQDNIAVELNWKFPDDATDYKSLSIVFRSGEANRHQITNIVAGYETTDTIRGEQGLNGLDVSCPFEPNTIYKLIAKRFQGNVEIDVFNGGNLLCQASYTYSSNETAGNIAIYSDDQNDYGNYIDDFFVRKYVEPEPTTTVGAEEYVEPTPTPTEEPSPTPTQSPTPPPADETPERPTLLWKNIGYFGFDWGGTWYNQSGSIKTAETVVFTLKNGTNYLTGELYIDGNKIADFDGNKELSYTFTKTGDHEIDVYNAEESITNVPLTITVHNPEGFENYFAIYIGFIKTTLPSLTGIMTLDVMLWGFLILPGLTIILLKVGVAIIKR